MKERPILFSAPMVRAILEGRKTQTRRICKPGFSLDTLSSERQEHYDVLGWVNIGGFIIPPCPYGQAGDYLWVREAWAISNVASDFVTVYYKASEQASHTEFNEQIPVEKAGRYSKLNPSWPKWKPSIHMPRAFSRIDLLITAVRPERLQDISVDDAQAEGIRNGEVFYFMQLWKSINGAASWDANPFVWVVEFETVHQ